LGHGSPSASGLGLSYTEVGACKKIGLDTVKRIIAEPDARTRLAQAELGLHAAREREQETARTSQALAERARHQLALCP
jgi:hypothetical protein